MPLHSDVITDITSQLGDPSKIRYEVRAKIHFINAVSQLIEEEKYTEEDLHGFTKLSTTITFSGGSENIQALEVLKILEIFMNPDDGDQVTVTVKSDEEMRKINSVSIMKPTKFDVFIHRVGNTLYANVSPTNPLFVLGTDIIHMKYIKYPRESDWSSDPEMTTLFSRTFISAAVRISVATLKVEDEVLA